MDVLVIGAGPGGLATSQQLTARGLDHRVLERGDVGGYTWANLYDSPPLHTGKRMSTLPGRKFPRHYATFVPRSDFWEYLRGYAESFRLPVQVRSPVTRLERANGGWRAPNAQGTLDSRAVVVATGILANPLMPHIPGRERFDGSLLHSVEY